MMRCAIYTRRSTDEHQAASLGVQQEEAERYITAKGWTLDPAHVFVDDAISRAEFKKRPGLIALLRAAEAKAFDVVICRDETRLGGDTNLTGVLIGNILSTGTRLRYYFADEEVRLNSAMDKFLVATRSFTSELEREKISQRTHEHLQTKARRGLAVGGKVYGYDNIEIKEGDRRVRVEYKINPDQARIVQEIFRRYAAGESLKAIAKDLNLRGIPSPRGRGWSYGCLFEMIGRDRYRGILVWGRVEKTYRGGTKVRVPRPEGQWTKVVVDELRIIDDALWTAAQARLSAKRKYERTRPSGARPKYLLSGFSRCGVCGGRIQVINGKSSHTSVKVYVCAAYREKRTCSNSLRRPVESVDHAVLTWIDAHLLREGMVAEVVQEVRRQLTERALTSGAELAELETQARKLRHELARMVEAIATTNAPPQVLVKSMGERERFLSVVEGRIAAAKTTPASRNAAMTKLEKAVRERLQDLQGLAARHPEEARRALEALLVGPLTFTPVDTPEGKRFLIEGRIQLTPKSGPGGVSMNGVPSGI